MFTDYYFTKKGDYDNIIRVLCEDGVIMKIKNKSHKTAVSSAFAEGMRDAIPIGLGYFAISFSLGIAARNAGLSAFQGFLASLFNNASAGEYAAFTLIEENGAYMEMFIITLIANARYLLMSSALSQKIDPDMPFFHRFIIAFDVTDEIFGISVLRPGYLKPEYSYGAFTVALPAWSLGTAFGVIIGNILPLNVVSALSVALYGMFLAVIMPAAKKDKYVAVFVLAGFALSYAFSVLPFVKSISSGTRTIILTVVISGFAALVFPRKEEAQDEE